ncbi:MAG: hypothetical protein ABIL16_08020 [candidate division WOR-3 bacterium]
MKSSLKNLKRFSLLSLLLLGCVERFRVEEGKGVVIEGGKGVWVLTTLSPEVWYIKDSAQRVIFASLWANDMLKVGDTLFIVNSGTNYVYRFITTTGEVETLRVGYGRNPYALAYSKISNTLFVSNFLTGTITAFRGNVLLGEFPTCGNPEGMNTVGGKLYVACTNYYSDRRGEVWVHSVFNFDTIRTYETGINSQMVISDGEGDVYVISTGDYSSVQTSLFRISQNGVDSFYIGGYLGNACISDKGYLFLVGWYGGVYRFNWVEERGEGFIITDISASSCDVKGDTLVVSDFNNDRVVYYDFSGKIIKYFYVGDGPIDVEAE